MSLRERFFDTVLLTVLFPSLLCLLASLVLFLEALLLFWFCKPH